MEEHELNPTHPDAPFLKREISFDFQIPRHIAKASGSSVDYICDKP